MECNDVIRKIGRFPDTINPKKRMASKSWRCSNCSIIYHFNESVGIPVPCKVCNGIAFEKISLK